MMADYMFSVQVKLVLWSGVMPLFYSQYTVHRVFTESNLWSSGKWLVLKQLWVNILERRRLRSKDRKTARIKWTHAHERPLFAALHASLLSVNDERSLPRKHSYLCVSHQSNVPAPSPVCWLVRNAVDVETPSALTPAGLPLDDRDLRPGGSPPRQDNADKRGALQACRLHPYPLLNGSEWENTPRLIQCRETDCIEKWEKLRQRCWQLWCVLRGMHRCYHSLSYARMVRWKPLPGTVLGLGLLMHRLNAHSTANTHTHTHTLTHTQSQADPALKIL